MTDKQHSTTGEIVASETVGALAGRMDPQVLILKAIETGAGIETMERLVALAEHVREVQARAAWYSAMAEFQRRCPAIKKTAEATIQGRTGRMGYSYKFAPLDEILSTIQPVLGPLGLSVSWRSRVELKQVVVSCRISHTLGHHEESGEIAMPVMEGESGANAAQRVGIAATYAKRYSLLGIIGMAPEDDDDTESQSASAPPAKEDFATITLDQQKRFHAIGSAHGWDEHARRALLVSKGYGSTKEILASEYDFLIDTFKAGPPEPSA